MQHQRSAGPSTAAPSTVVGESPSAVCAFVVIMGSKSPNGGSRCAVRAASSRLLRGSWRPRGQKASRTLSVPTTTGTPAARSSPIRVIPRRSACRIAPLQIQVRRWQAGYGQSGPRDLVQKRLQRLARQVDQAAGVTAQHRALKPGFDEGVGNDLKPVQPVMQAFIHVKIKRQPVFFGHAHSGCNCRVTIRLIQDEHAQNTAATGDFLTQRIRARASVSSAVSISGATCSKTLSSKSFARSRSTCHASGCASEPGSGDQSRWLRTMPQPEDISSFKPRSAVAAGHPRSRGLGRGTGPQWRRSDLRRPGPFLKSCGIYPGGHGTRSGAA